jgi:hypothetical protein
MACSAARAAAAVQGEMVMLPDLVAWFPALSVRVMVNLAVS